MRQYNKRLPQPEAEDDRDYDHQEAPRHDQKFWTLVERVLPDYQNRQRRLAEEGGQYISVAMHA